jgi:molybdate transport system permease protein
MATISLGQEVVTTATSSLTGSMVISLQVVMLAMVFVVPIGFALGFLQHRGHRWQHILDMILLLPVVLPPSVLGFLLLFLLGKHGWLGQWLFRWFAIQLPFSTTGAALAAGLVALPLFAKGTQVALQRVPRELEEIALVHGMSPLRILRSITLPLAWPGVGLALVLAFARALGEFGATLTFAGYVQGVTSTMPLEIQAAIQRGDDRSALLLTGVLLSCSTLVAWLMTRMNRRV